MNLLDRISDYVTKAKQNSEFWKRTVFSLAAVVVFVTTYVMILPAITLDKDHSAPRKGIYLEDKDMTVSEDGEAVYHAASADKRYEVSVKYGDGSSAEDSSDFRIREIGSEDSLFRAYRKELTSCLDGKDGKKILSMQMFDLESIDSKGEESSSKGKAEITVTYNQAAKIGEDCEIRAFSGASASKAAWIKASLVRDGDSVKSVTYETEQEGLSGIVIIGSSDKAAEDAASANDKKSSDETAAEGQTVPSEETTTEGVSEETSEKTEGKDVKADSDKEAAKGTEGTLTASGSDYTVTLSYGEDSGLPAEGASLKVSELDQKSKAYKSYMEKAKNSFGKEKEITHAKLYDISIMVDGEEVEPKAPVHVEIQAKEMPSEKEGDISMVHFPDKGKAEILDDKDVELKKKKDTVKGVEFEADQFSVYGIVYTVDFHYTVNGKTYDYSIPGGGFISIETLLEKLGAAENAQEAKELVAEISDISFSNPDLVWVGKVENDTTVGDLKEAQGLDCRYSVGLTEDQIEEINAQTVKAGDWALISLLPFDTKEKLTITMSNGDVWTIKVTDVHEISDASVVDSNKSYLIGTHDANGYHLLKTDGTTETFQNTDNFDKLDGDYHWALYYVFTEKDRETSLDYTYYIIRPVSDKTKSIALNEASGHEDLVQTGANNIAIIPQENGGFVFLGYNHSEDYHIELGYDSGEFVAYNDKTDNPTIIRIFEQDPLPEYSFTVRTADPEKGKVSGRNENNVQQNNVDSYITKTTTTGSPDDKRNNYQITANPVNHMSGGQNKWIFDYWDLDGVKLEGVGRTINANTQIIQRNGSVLTAHFKQNPNYVVPDNEKEGTEIQDLSQWINDLKTRNIPLNEDGTKKTAEVYDYENRIYRVDLTAQSSLTTFDGTIDLGFVLDVSASMNFPSLLYNSSDVTGIRDLSHINDRTYYGDRTQGEKWGLNTNKTYYIIADPDGTATVCYLYYYQNNWWLCDASKDKYTGNGRFDPSNGHSADNTQYYNNSYYKTTNYVIQEAGDRVTQADMNTDGALLNKLGLGVGDPKSRAFYLEKSLNGTISELNEILGILSIAKNSTQNPDVKIAWNTFKNYLPNGTGQLQHNFVSASSGVNLNYDKNTYGGGTSTDAALLDAAGVDRYLGIDHSSKDIKNRYSDDDRKNWKKTTQDYNNNGTYYVQNHSSGFQWENNTTKYAVLITDGAPQRSSVSIDSRYVSEAAQQLKNRGVKLVTVGLGIDNVTSGKILLYDIADSMNNEKMFYSAKSGDELEDVLLQIVKTIMIDASVQGDVTDTISKAFYPVEKNTGKQLTEGTMIDLEGNVTQNANQPHGTITYDQQTGLYGVKWEGQNFTWDGWHGSVYVKAYEDLLGGNALNTNNGNALIEAKTYKTKDNSAAIELADHPDNQYFKKLVERESPKVNVNELNLTRNETEWTVYLNTEVDPKEQLKSLFENIKVEEVINRGTDEVDDKFDIEDMIDYSGPSSHHYPLAPNDFSDKREEQATGTEITFRMKDLIRELIDDCIASGDTSYNWNSFISGEKDLNWDNLLNELLTHSIAIPYDKYGINDPAHKIVGDDNHHDNSTVILSLTQEVVQGEKDLTESPHNTEVVGAQVEKYTLTVTYTPDYDVLPKGQGGKSEEDFHTGTFGTIYQGHAAGTETSVNTHIINVIKRIIEIQKTDVAGNLKPEATFKVYQKDGEGNEINSFTLTTSGGKATWDYVVPDEDQKVAGDYWKDSTTWYIKEETAPEGYAKYEGEIEVILGISDTKTDISTADAGSTAPYNWTQTAALTASGDADYVTVTGNDDLVIAVKNDKSVDISVIKTGKDNAEISGATFSLSKDSEAVTDLKIVKKGGSWDNPEDRISVDNGMFVIPEGGITILGLGAGDYTLTEVSAPTGYVKTLQPITFTVGRDGTVNYTNTNHNPVIEGHTSGVTPSNDNTQYTVLNEPGAELPNAGGVGTESFTVLGILLLALAAIGLTMRSRTRSS